MQGVVGQLFNDHALSGLGVAFDEGDALQGEAAPELLVDVHHAHRYERGYLLRLFFERLFFRRRQVSRRLHARKRIDCGGGLSFRFRAGGRWLVARKHRRLLLQIRRRVLFQGRFGFGFHIG